MKPADKVFLDGLRKSVCDHIPQDHWDLVVKAVTDAGDIRDVTGYARTIILEGVEKGRFASRSEAGRYAANMRWRGSVPQGGLATAEARQEANAKAGKGSGNPARGGSAAKRKEAFDDLFDTTLADVKGGFTDGKKALTHLRQAGKAGITSTAGKKSLRQAGKLFREAGLDDFADVVNEVLTGESVFSKASFSSRSEAGRYAANMRWKGQGKTTATTDGAGNTQRSRDAIAHWEGIRSKAEEAQHRAADNGQGEEVGRLQGVIDRADHELAIERETILPKGQPTSEEAQIKQAFIDTQKERLGRMGRGTSQIAHMALEAGIKQLEAELASGDTSEARNRPGQFFDDRPGAKGEKYIGRRPNKEVAVDIRRDLKSAQESGQLPAGLKFGVKMGSGGNSITVTVKGISNPRVRDDLGRDVTSPEAKAVYDKVDRITNAYNRNNSDMMTDYFDTDYYGFVTIEG